MRLPIERFLEKTNILSFTECCEWTGRLSPWGYALFDVIGKSPQAAHRWIYEHCFGPIPKGMTVDHECHNRADCKGGNGCPHRRCVNPFHLVLRTLEENIKASPNFFGNRLACFRGHVYTSKTVKMVNGIRVCLTCEAIRVEGRRGKPRQHRVTMCKHGHPYTPENTYVSPDGGWNCRTCHREAKKRHRQKVSAQ